MDALFYLHLEKGAGEGSNMTLRRLPSWVSCRFDCAVCVDDYTAAFHGLCYYAESRRKAVMFVVDLIVVLLSLKRHCPRLLPSHGLSLCICHALILVLLPNSHGSCESLRFVGRNQP